MKTKTYLAFALGLALAGVAAGCGDEYIPPNVDGGNLGGMGGNIGSGGDSGTGGNNADGGADADLTFGAFVIDLIKNQTTETAAPTSLEGKTFQMSDDITTFVELLK